MSFGFGFHVVNVHVVNVHVVKGHENDQVNVKVESRPRHGARQRPRQRNVDVDVATSKACGRYSNMLTFQNLHVYQRALELLALVNEIIGDLPDGHGDRADQLVRAAESVVRNIAEGAGRWSRQDSAKHFKIARGEVMEVAASLDILRLRKLVSRERLERAARLLEATVAMLTKMAR